MKLLFIDIETSPLTAYAWGLWKQNIATSQIIDSSSVMCWSAKWYHDSHVMYASIMDKGGEKAMLKKMWKLLDEADVVVHYNGTKFDVPTLNKEFIKHNMPPPSPYKQLDLLQVARRQFRFHSNKLDFVAQQLGLGKKHKHEGFELWVKCMDRDKDAWRTMETYNKQDVVLLEKVYVTFRPWIKNHPNYSVYNEKSGMVCSTCGSSHLQRRGYSVSSVSKYQRWQCIGCGTWMRERLASPVKPTLVGDKT